jgi:predicted  nucleic acid-binding Zn-ribbon protein
MTTARQLYQLQCIELDIESKEKELEQSQARLGESQQLLDAREKLELGRQRLVGLKQQQKDAEWQADDVGAKLAAARDSLYSGSIRSPKELSSLQHEVESLQSKRDSLDEAALEIMEQVEAAAAAVEDLGRELGEVENEWRQQQKQLTESIEELKESLSVLGSQRQQALAGIDAASQDCYRRLRQQKGQAVARVEQGTCRGCRISLSTAELQRAKGNSLVTCSSCGRILFID